MSSKQSIDEAKVKKLVERKLEIRTQIQQLRVESRKIDEELARVGSGNPLVSTVIGAW